MKWDNFGLPYTSEDDNRDLCLQNLALYFINIHCHKKLIDAQFRLKHPVRKRLEDETHEDYDNYLTQHTNAYRVMLEKNDLEYMAEADVHFYDKCIAATYGIGQLHIHPILRPRQLDYKNEMPMVAAMVLYNFMDIVQKQPIKRLPTLFNLFKERNNTFFRYLGDTLLLFSVFIDSQEVIMSQLVVAKERHPTWMSKLATKLFLKRKISSWTSIVEYLKG